MKKSHLAKTATDVSDQKPLDGEGRVLDAIDKRILRTLQRDSLITNQALADEIGLSPRPA